MFFMQKEPIPGERIHVENVKSNVADLQQGFEMVCRTTNNSSLLYYGKYCKGVRGPWDLRGRTVLITGSAKGLGKMTAITLAQRGCQVAVNYVNSRKGSL